MTVWHDGNWLCAIREKCIRRALLVAARWCSRSATAAAEDHRYTAAAVRIDHHHKYNNKNNRLLPLPPPPPFTLYSYHRHRRRRRICWRHRSPRASGAVPPVNGSVISDCKQPFGNGWEGGKNPRGRVVGNAFRVVFIVHPSEKAHRVSFFLPFDPVRHSIDRFIPILTASGFLSNSLWNFGSVPLEKKRHPADMARCTFRTFRTLLQRGQRWILYYIVVIVKLWDAYNNYI